MLGTYASFQDTRLVHELYAVVKSGALWANIQVYCSRKIAIIVNQKLLDFLINTCKRKILEKKLVFFQLLQQPLTLLCKWCHKWLACLLLYLPLILNLYKSFHQHHIYIAILHSTVCLLCYSTVGYHSYLDLYIVVNMCVSNV